MMPIPQAVDDDGHFFLMHWVVALPIIQIPWLKGNLWIPKYELFVVVCQTKKLVHLINISQQLPILDFSQLLKVGFQQSMANYVTQELDPSLGARTLSLFLYNEFCLSNSKTSTKCFLCSSNELL